ncbi:hypothetical protein [Candidatus Nitrospira bockiana]
MRTGWGPWVALVLLGALVLAAPGASEAVYDPGYSGGFFDDGYYDDDWFFDYYEGTGSQEAGYQAGYYDERGSWRDVNDLQMIYDDAEASGIFDF